MTFDLRQSRVLPAAIMAGVGSFLLFILHYADHGFDVTDEGMHLASIRNAARYSASVTQFGFVFHGIYALLDGNVGLLRTTNVLLIFLLTFWTCWIWLASFIRQTQSDALTLPQLGALSSALAVSGLMITKDWLITPNYNTLTLEGLLLALASSQFGSTKDRACLMAFSAALTGLGLWLAFLAKPTAAAVGIFLVAILLVARKRQGLYFLALVGVACLIFLWLTSLLIDNELGRFYQRLASGYELVVLLDGGQTEIFSAGKFIFRQLPERWPVLFGLSVASAAGLRLAMTEQRFPAGGGTALLAVLLSITQLGLWGVLPFLRHMQRPLDPLITLAPAIGMFLALAFSPRDLWVRLDANSWRMIALTAACSLALLLGTNRNYWQALETAVVFPTLAAAGLCLTVTNAACRRRVILSFSAMVVAACTVQLAGAVQWPHRNLTPVYAQDVPIEIGDPPSRLWVSNPVAAYLATAIKTARNAGFAPQHGLIDLSGQSPGLAFALGTFNPGVPWLVGGYRGSERFALRALEIESCRTLATAWVLSEPEGKRPIPAQLLANIGAELASDYELVGSWAVPSKTRTSEAVSRQFLWRPRRAPEAATAVCEAHRQSR